MSGSFDFGARFSEEHHGANEFFRIVVGFAVVMFAPGHTHRLDEPFSKVVHEARFGAGHVGDQSLQDPFMSQHTPFELGGLWGCHRHGVVHPPSTAVPAGSGDPSTSRAARQACAISRFGASVPGTVAQPADMTASRR